QSDTLNFKLDQLKSMFNVIRVTIGEALIPAIEDITTKVMAAIIKVKEWTEANKPLTESLVKWGAGVSGVMLVLGPLMMMLPGLVIALPKIAGAIKGISLAIAGAIGGLALLSPPVAGAILLTLAVYDIYTKVVKVLKEGGGILKESKRIREAEAGAIEAQSKALEKLQEAYNLTEEDVKRCMDAHKITDGVMQKIKNTTRELSEEKYGLVEALGDVSEYIGKERASLEELDSAIAVSIITGG
ncbi:unnamed protein product, partial [marine sediment metagenome]